MNRFLINLRSLDTTGMGSFATQTFPEISLPTFRLGSIGESLDHSGHENEESTK